MEQQEVTIISDGQTSPAGTTTPPKRGKWYDTFSYIANPERFCQRNLEKYGAIFNTGVFGGTTIFVGSSRAIQMVFKDAVIKETLRTPCLLALQLIVVLPNLWFWMECFMSKAAL